MNSTGDRRILTAVGESEFLTVVGEGKNLLIVESEKSWDRCWGILVLRRSSLENIRIFCEELRMRVFTLLGD